MDLALQHGRGWLAGTQPGLTRLVEQLRPPSRLGLPFRDQGQILRGKLRPDIKAVQTQRNGACTKNIQYHSREYFTTIGREFGSLNKS